MNDRENLSEKTRLVHTKKVSLPEGNEPLVSPIHQSVKYIPDTMSQFRRILSGRGHGYLYSRISNPTVRELELSHAELQGREDAIATARDRKSTRLNSSHEWISRMPSSA